MFVRKHYTQMSIDEINCCLLKVNRWILESWEVTGHAIGRILEKEVQPISLAYTLKDFDIIEYKLYQNGQERVLVRSRDSFDSYHVCMVLDVSSGKIITVWLNHELDQHQTLNLSQYSDTLIVQ